MADVENVDRLCRALEPEQYGSHAVANMQVALALLSITQHLEPSRVRAQLAPEIEDVTVRVARAQHRYEAVDVDPETVAMRVGGKQALRGQLGGSVERGLNRKRGILGRRQQ